MFVICHIMGTEIQELTHRWIIKAALGNFSSTQQFKYIKRVISAKSHNHILQLIPVALYHVLCSVLLADDNPHNLSVENFHYLLQLVE